MYQICFNLRKYKFLNILFLLSFENTVDKQWFFLEVAFHMTVASIGILHGSWRNISRIDKSYILYISHQFTHLILSW